VLCRASYSNSVFRLAVNSLAHDKYRLGLGLGLGLARDQLSAGRSTAPWASAYSAICCLAGRAADTQQVSVGGPGVGDHVSPSLCCGTRLDVGVLVGCGVQPFLQASEVARSWFSRPFLGGLAAQWFTAKSGVHAESQSIKQNIKS